MKFFKNKKHGHQLYLSIDTDYRTPLLSMSYHPPHSPSVCIDLKLSEVEELIVMLQEFIPELKEAIAAKDKEQSEDD